MTESITEPELKPDYKKKLAEIIKGKNLSREEFMEAEIRPEYVIQLKKIEKEGEYHSFSSIEELQRYIEKS